MLSGNLIQRVQSRVSGGVESQSSRLRSRHIWAALVGAYGFVLSEEIRKKRQTLGEVFYMLLPCVEMIKAPAHECTCVPARGCEIYRSKHKIPKRLEIFGVEYIRFVMRLDNSETFSKTTVDRVRVKYSNPFTKNLKEYYFENDYLYVTEADDFPKLIKMSFAPADPLQAAIFPNFCDTSKCVNPYEIEFPVRESTANQMIEVALNELQFKGEDKTANASDDKK